MPFDWLGWLPLVKKLRQDLMVARTLNEVAASNLEKLNNQIEGHKQVLQQVVNERSTAIKQRDEWKTHADNGWNAAKAWRGLAEDLQGKFAMLEQRGRMH